MREILFGLTFLMLCNVSLACYRPAIDLVELNGQPIERIMSPNGKFLLEMYPAKWSQAGEDFTKVKESIGIVYSVADDGLMNTLWEMEGIYNRRYDPQENDFFFDTLAHYLTNDGNKILSVLKKRKLPLHGSRKNKKRDSFVTVFDRSGIIIEITNAQLKGKPVYGCGIIVINSHEITPEDNVKITTVGVPSGPLSKEWLLMTNTGELKRIH